MMMKANVLRKAATIATCAVVASTTLFAPEPAQAAPPACWSFVRNDCTRNWEYYSQFYPDVDACVEGEYPKMCPWDFDAPIQEAPTVGRIEE